MKSLNGNHQQRPAGSTIQSLRIGLASPEKIISWSHGEVKKPETFNYRTYKPEKDGLFCERIFGPVKDYECACGKYKKKRYKGVTCERCGVEVTTNRVRRERLGHIRLASPVAHIWFTKSIPNRFSALMGISGKEIEKVIYFVSWLVTSVDHKWIHDKIGDIETLVNRHIAEMESEKRQLRNLETVNLFEVAKMADIDATRKRDITMTAKALEGEAPSNFEGRYDEKLEAIRDLLLQSELLKPYKVASEVLDPMSGEIIARPGDKFSHPLLHKLLFLGGFEITVENIDLGIDAVKRIEEINERKHALVGDGTPLRIGAVQMLKQSQPLDRLNDQQHEDYNQLRMLCLMGNMGDLDEHVRLGIGAQAVQEALRNLDLVREEQQLSVEMHGATSQKKQKLIKRLKVVRAFGQSGNRPEWMIQTVLPVLPPELRPMVELEGGRFASSDLNDLYRRVINRNNRLKKLIDIRAPESILRNERRMLQEAVDALIDNGRKGRAAVNVNNRALKSLSDMLKGKQGRFRQNLLGKRVDYSGRSVIVVGPSLRLHQCGLPKYMALELFKPFILNRLIDPTDPNQNIAQARRTLERAEDPRVWDALEEITRSHPVLLNRAPTLHRLSIQAFEPVLIEGKAIKLHPLVCAAYNADFDGDQMAVHVPLSTAAQAEARLLMLSANNLLLPADGKPIVSPTHDVVLGTYYMTQLVDEVRDDSKLQAFTSINDALNAYHHGHITLQQPVRVHWTGAYTVEPDLEHITFNDGLIVTTAGRMILNNKMQETMADQFDDVADYPVPYVNCAADKNMLSSVIDRAFKRGGQSITVALADALKDLGFEMATQSGVTVSASDILVPAEKDAILGDAQAKADEIWSKRKKRIITELEKDREVTRIWDEATRRLTKAMKENFGPLNSINMMATSGARGKMDQVRQLAAMRGLLVGPSGRVLDFPIKSNFREGLSVFEYFISTHGGRKGLVDTALKTADSGYLTRRLIDVSLDVSITEDDCGSTEGVELDLSGADSIRRVKKLVLGRVLAADAVGAKNKVVLPAGTEIRDEEAEALFDKPAGVSLVPSVRVRSVLTCNTLHGVCANCYGWDLAAGRMCQIGDPVGVVAAQSIGEPGTQLTMRTFHTGGVKGRDITQGLPYVDTLFEVRGVATDNVAVIAEEDGEVVRMEEMVSENVTIQATDSEHEKTFEIVHPYHERLRIHFRSRVRKDEPLDDTGAIKAEFEGIVTRLFTNVKKTFWRIFVRNAEGLEKEYVTRAFNPRPLVTVGQRVQRGYQLCEGDLDLRKYHLLMGDLSTQLYIANKIQEIYENQNVNTNSKHIEVISKQMIRFVEITDPGDVVDFYEGDLMDRGEFRHLIAECEREGRRPPQGKSLLQGISKSSLSTESFLAAASFQETTRVLTEAAIEGKVDHLKGLKENVIIGGLIPAGTGRIAARLEEKAAAAVFGGDAAAAAKAVPQEAENIFMSDGVKP
jgi:DNA-directed RNA polymerase subunit beta'